MRYVLRLFVKWVILFIYFDNLMGYIVDVLFILMF